MQITFSVGALETTRTRVLNNASDSTGTARKKYKVKVGAKNPFGGRQLPLCPYVDYDNEITMITYGQRGKCHASLCAR